MSWRRIVEELAISRAGVRPLATSGLVLSIVVATVVIFYHDVWARPEPFTSNAHATQSVDSAVNAHFCGDSSHLSMRYSPHVFLTTRPDLMAHPFRTAVGAQVATGTVTEYCRSLTAPIVVSENSLMWLARFALWVHPRLTPDGLGGFLAATRVLMLVLFGFALLRSGAPVLLSVAAVAVGCAILRAVGIRDTIYPFVLTLPLLHAACYGLAHASERLKRDARALSAFACGMGLLMGFSSSMRTVLLPLGTAMFALFLVAVFRDPECARTGRRSRIAGAAIAYGVGYAAYMAVFIYSLKLPDTAGVSNATYHTVAHQLVIGLAVPENDLSRSEGIEWRDEAGWAIARRIVPDVAPFSEQYERTMFQYYQNLWRTRPREMLRTYVTKLRSAGTEVFLGAATIGAEFGIPRGPGEWLHRTTNGVLLLLLAGLTCGLASAAAVSRHQSRMLIVACVALSALAALAESFLTYSIFVGMYFSELLFFVFFVFLISIQAAIDALAGFFAQARSTSRLQPQPR